MKITKWIFIIGLYCSCNATSVYAQNIAEANAAIKNHQFATAETLLVNEVQKHPNDAQAKFLLARVLAWQGKHDEALIQYDQLLTKSPHNVDYLLGKSYVLLWQHQPAQALPLLKQARASHPNYEEVWRAEIQALEATQEASNISEANTLRAQAKQKFPQSDWSEKTPEPITQAIIVKPNQVEVGGGYNALTNNYDDWHNTYLYGSHDFATHQNIYGGVRNTNRFALNDNQFLIGTTQPLAPRWSSHFEVTHSPTHHVVADWSILGGVVYSIGDGWNVEVNEARKMYSTGSNSTSVTLDRYFSTYRLAYTVSRGAPDGGGSAIGNRVEGDYYYGSENYIRLSLSEGDELSNEVVDGNPSAPPIKICNTTAPRGETTLVECHVRGIAISGRHWFMPDWAISYQVGYHEQDNLYSDKGVQLGLRHRF
jgi:YaiO family outer membrane protein